MGIYVFNREILDHIPADTYFGFDTLMAEMLRAGSPVRSYPFEGRWLDIGNPSDYERAQSEFEENQARYLPDATASDG
jgi:NDP-sugar pyrophosphorylase family protein